MKVHAQYIYEAPFTNGYTVFRGTSQYDHWARQASEAIILSGQKVYSGSDANIFFWNTSGNSVLTPIGYGEEREISVYGIRNNVNPFIPEVIATDHEILVTSQGLIDLSLWTTNLPNQSIELASGSENIIIKHEGFTGYSYRIGYENISKTILINNSDLDLDPGSIVYHDGILRDSIPPHGAFVLFEWEASIDGGWSYTSLGMGQEFPMGIDYLYDLSTNEEYYVRRKATTLAGVVLYTSSIRLCNPGQISGTQVVFDAEVPDKISSGDRDFVGMENPIYEWEYSDDNGKNWIPISGATGVEYTFTKAWAVGDYWFRRKAYQLDPIKLPEVYSNVVQLHVLDQLEEGSLITEKVIREGESVHLNKIAPTVVSTLQYEWYESDNGTDDWRINTSLTTFDPEILPSHTKWYKRRVKGSLGYEDTAPVQVVVVKSGEIEGPSNVCNGMSPTISSIIDGTNGLGTHEYRWERSIDGGIWNTIEAATEATLTESLPLTKNTRYRRFTVYNGVESVSDEVNINVNVYPPLAVGGISGPVSLCVNSDLGMLSGDPASGGDGQYTYIWEVNENGFFEAINHPSSPNLMYNKTIQKTTTFKRTVIDGCGNSIESEHTVEVTSGMECGLFEGCKSYARLRTQLNESFHRSYQGKLLFVFEQYEATSKEYEYRFLDEQGIVSSPASIEMGYGYNQYEIELPDDLEIQKFYVFELMEGEQVINMLRFYYTQPSETFDVSIYTDNIGTNCLGGQLNVSLIAYQSGGIPQYYYRWYFSATPLEGMDESNWGDIEGSTQSIQRQRAMPLYIALVAEDDCNNQIIKKIEIDECEIKNKGISISNINFGIDIGTAEGTL
ncbi:hypothetical protein [Algivirga pacifica]|uniref:Ig-like domain-containing protein n=1 Tax=Algivirga pacifica TaxID=1162670 RepID=A0ABP9DJT0_9BACT